MKYSVLWGLIMGSCLQSVIQLSATDECLGWVVPLSLPVIGGLSWIMHWTWKQTLYLRHNFVITIINTLPPNFHADPPSVRSLPVGGNDVLLCIYPRYKFKVKRVDFRILNQKFRPIQPTYGFPDFIEITRLEDLYDGGLAISQSNGMGGMEGEYTSVRSLARGQGLYFKIRIEARQVGFYGHISVRTQNEDGERSMARYPVYIDPDIPPSEIPMRPWPTLANLPYGWPAPPPEAL